jgi:hypothetical protein
MKNTIVFRLLGALALLVFALIWAQPVANAQREGDPAAPLVQQQEQQQPNSLGQLPGTKTFSGKIMKSGDKLVLQDGVGESIYQLDDQTKAWGFEGKNVKVTGTIDAVNNTIHIAKLEPEL